ncbi:chymotrypsin inhibitor-like protein [Leptotrombidium deliense]|uniref:Chymotrypsin inhibitor-like protein n=1 Tax=Leptotrombidium deliense TaxID=299467 RepID=A0A443RYI2_9ACAR|nr:chymotrypsin inhibitor-like protein [Leptotrombidium deliense]
MRNIVLIAVLVALVVSVNAFCGENSVFKYCGNCDQKCETIDNPIKCSRGCWPGCRCNDGYVRGPEAKCIKKEDCKVTNSTLVQ